MTSPLRSVLQALAERPEVAGVVVVSILAMALIDLAKLLPPLRRTLAVQSQRT